MPSARIHAAFYLSYAATADKPFILDVDLDLPGRGVIGLFGRSGSGKTTLLRCIAGLQQAERGELHVRGETWQDKTTFVPTHKRPLGYVFQEASLFPHLTAKQNLAFAMKRSGAADTNRQYNSTVDLMGIGGLLGHYPAQLSGGERQRIAIARALLIQPRLLLMDEPLASLDQTHKQEILPYLERLHTELDIPVIYVSHASDEIARLADFLVVLDHGKVVARGPLTEVMSRLDFPIPLGDDTGVVVDTSVVERDTRWHLVRVVFPGGELWLRDNGDQIGRTIRVRILARDVSLALESHDSSILNRLQGEVTAISPDTDEAMALVRLNVNGSTTIIARVTQKSVDHLQLAPGKQVWAQIKSVAIVR